MNVPDSLPARAYLLAYDRERGRLTGRTLLAHTLRGAALVELWISGAITDDDGHAVVPVGARPPTDPVLCAVFDEVSAGRRKWEALIGRHRGQTETVIREQLDHDRWIRITRPASRFRSARIDMRNPRVLTRLAAQVGATLRGPQSIGRLDRRTVGLVAVLATGEVRTAITKEQSREYARRIDAAIAASGPAVPALKRALRQARSSAS